MRTNGETFRADAAILAHGKPCYCCQELNWQAPEVWRNGFVLPVDKEKAVLVYRIKPAGDYNLKYHGRNWRVACSQECALTYSLWWASHPKREELRGFIESGAPAAIHPGRKA